MKTTESDALWTAGHEIIPTAVAALWAQYAAIRDAHTEGMDLCAGLMADETPAEAEIQRAIKALGEVRVSLDHQYEMINGGY